MKHIAGWALDVCHAQGVQYAEIRIVDDRQRALSTKNGKVGYVSDSESLGAGIRVLANGAWGFAATEDLTREGIEITAGRALEIARSSARVKQEDVRLAPEKAYVDDWASPCRIDPFTTSVEQNIDLLLKIDAELRAVAGITLAEANLNFRRYEQWFYNTDGSDIHQVKTTVGAGYAAYAFAGSEIQKRSYPNSFGGQHQDERLRADRRAAAAGERRAHRRRGGGAALGRSVPEGELRPDPGRRSLGCRFTNRSAIPIELDRVLGMEANYRGHDLSDARQAAQAALRLRHRERGLRCATEHGPGLGTFAFDDEGVPAQCTPIISRRPVRRIPDLARDCGQIGAARSGGTMRADGWNRDSDDPHDQRQPSAGRRKPLTLEELIASTDHGIYMETNRSWSIDDKRYNFQFGMRDRLGNQAAASASAC